MTRTRSPLERLAALAVGAVLFLFVSDMVGDAVGQVERELHQQEEMQR